MIKEKKKYQSFTLRLPTKLHYKFKLKCLKNKIAMTNALEEMIKKYLIK